MIGFNLTFVRRYFRSQLVRKFSEREAEQLLRILFEDLFGLDRMKILMNQNLTIDEFQYHQMEKAVGVCRFTQFYALRKLRKTLSLRHDWL